jgi:hypothetical protein
MYIFICGLKMAKLHCWSLILFFCNILVIYYLIFLNMLNFIINKGCTSIRHTRNTTDKYNKRGSKPTKNKQRLNQQSRKRKQTSRIPTKRHPHSSKPKTEQSAGIISRNKVAFIFICNTLFIYLIFL